MFAKGTSSLGAPTFTRPSIVNEPIVVKAPEGSQYRDVVIRPGDIIIADIDGVVRIPVDQLEAVIERAEVILQQDAACMRALKQGMPLKEAFETFRK